MVTKLYATDSEWIEVQPVCSICGNEPTVVYQLLNGLIQYACADCQSRMELVVLAAQDGN